MVVRNLDSITRVEVPRLPRSRNCSLPPDGDSTHTRNETPKFEGFDLLRYYEIRYQLAQILHLSGQIIYFLLKIQDTHYHDAAKLVGSARRN